MSINIRFISASAGSGKTYRLTGELEAALTDGRARPEGVIGTTFTNKAANELRERVRQGLIAGGRIQLANKMGQALLGTVNSVCGRLLQQFAFEAGLSPELEVLPEENDRVLFNQAVEAAIALEDIRLMNELGGRLSIDDWRDEVKDVVAKARANNIPPDRLLSFGKTNADELLSFFPAATDADLWSDLLTAVDDSTNKLKDCGDTTKKTLDYIDFLTQDRPSISEKRLKWSQWVKLSKKEPAKKISHLSEQVTNAFLQYDRHPELHADIGCFCETVFRLSAASLKQYQDLKRKRGLIDFVDQEQLILNALDHPEVFKTLKEELDLLLVDEFQDTSPIQLALFLKMAGAATEVVFVGDVKQAIYGFRGSDPELMLTVLREVKSQGGVTSILKSSWRSRPALISYTNNLFVPAFSNSISGEQVKLVPVRDEKTNQPAAEHWVLKGRNIGLRASALAAGIHALKRRNYKIVDKITEKTRPLEFEDIAVLARMNNTVRDITAALASSGIPVQSERIGLLETPEACLALACLRRMADPRDTLASAEIIALSSCDEPEAWLENRLNYLDSGGPGHLWGECEKFQHPVISALARQRSRLQHLTPSETLAHAINLAELRRIVTAWGPNQWRAQKRLQNLEALVSFAKEYEEHCKTQRQTATVAGLIVWLRELNKEKLDMQPGDSKSNAVHVLTHHKAKGLEWPVVIALDLNSKLKQRLWGSSAISLTGKLSLKNPLSDRFIRFWPYPFGKQKTQIRVVSDIESSEFGQACYSSAVEESKRLLYVSLTRARDLLILPLNGKIPSDPWMGTLNADWMLPKDNTMLLPDKTEIPTAHREFDASESAGISKAEGYKPFWLGPRVDPSDKPQAILNPSSMDDVPGVRVADSKDIGTSLEVHGSPKMDQLGLALHKLVASEIVNPSHKDALLTAERLLDSHGVSEKLDPKAVVTYAQHFIAYAKNAFQPDGIRAEYPVAQVLSNGQLVKGWIDFLIETSNGWVIVDHKFTAKPESELEQEALKYSGQLMAYKTAVEAASQKTVNSCWIHFPNNGLMVQIEVASYVLPQMYANKMMKTSRYPEKISDQG